jgi:hypothetical protein
MYVGCFSADPTEVVRSRPSAAKNAIRFASVMQALG